MLAGAHVCGHPGKGQIVSPMFLRTPQLLQGIRRPAVNMWSAIESDENNT